MRQINTEAIPQIIRKSSAIPFEVIDTRQHQPERPPFMEVVPPHLDVAAKRGATAAKMTKAMPAPTNTTAMEAVVGYKPYTEKQSAINPKSDVVVPAIGVARYGLLGLYAVVVLLVQTLYYVLQEIQLWYVHAARDNRQRQFNDTVKEYPRSTGTQGRTVVNNVHVRASGKSKIKLTINN